jgi:hypothetical protein
VAARRAVRDAPDSKERIGTRLKVDAAKKRPEDRSLIDIDAEINDREY